MWREASLALSYLASPPSVRASQHTVEGDHSKYGVCTRRAPPARAVTSQTKSLQRTSLTSGLYSHEASLTFMTLFQAIGFRCLDSLLPNTASKSRHKEGVQTSEKSDQARPRRPSLWARIPIPTEQTNQTQIANMEHLRFRGGGRTSVRDCAPMIFLGGSLFLHFGTIGESTDKGGQAGGHRMEGEGTCPSQGCWKPPVGTEVP